MRRLILPATALALSLSAFSTPASAAAPRTVYVRPDGKDVCSGTANVAYNSSLQCAKRTIQHAIQTVAGRGTVRVAAGTYVENVVVPKSVTILGAGTGKTIVLPALSNANPCSDSSLCGGAASSVFLLRASNIWIQGLTVDGDNPDKPGVLVDGTGVDARNGIIEDHTTGVYSGLAVRNVEVKNVFLRGINAASGGKNISIANSTVTHVLGDPASVAIFASGASGEIRDNHVSFANDAISVNHSRGFKITGNTVETSGSGVHIDNNAAPAPGVLLDLIEANTVSSCTPGGFGIWLFLPKGNATVSSNIVADCDVALALLGGGASSNILFSANVATGTGASNTAGIFVTTDTFGFGHYGAEALFTANSLSGFETGIYADQGAGKTATLYLDDQRVEDTFIALENHATVTVYESCLRQNDKAIVHHPSATTTVHMSSFAGNTLAAVENLATDPLDAADNYWGAPDGPAPTGSGDAVIGNVTFSPFLTGSPVACE
ncbi:MAG: NosD domain-containing protein [Polyangiaceae bacterium]